MASTAGRFDETFFTRVFKNLTTDGTVEIVEVRDNCISGKGTNFLSDLYRCSVRYTVGLRNGGFRSERCVDVVVKTEPFNSGNMVRFVREQELFQVELVVLRDVLPRIEEIADCQIGPRLLYGSKDPAVLVMEDLSKQGFVMKDRQKGLSLAHCELVMERLAKLHAGSVGILEKDPVSIKSVEGGILSSKCPASFMRFVEASFASVCEAIESWEDERLARPVGKLNRLKGTIRERCNDVYSYDDEFCVLNHGDCWVNNIMFKENDRGEPVDLRMVDYQMSVYCSPVIDLLYFLNICPEHEIKYEKDEHLLELYLATLSDTMKSMGCKTEPPTMEKLKAAIHKKRIYAVFAGFVLYLRMIANKEDTEDFEELLVKMSGETKMDVFKNPFAVRAARKMMWVMDERGYLD